MPVFARFVRNIQRDRTTARYAAGSFDIPPEIYSYLACDDYKEARSIFDFVNREPRPRQRAERQVKGQQIKKEEEQSRVGRFLRKVFGKKDKKR